MRAKGSHRFDSSATSLINHVPVTAESWTDHERPHTVDSHTDFFSIPCCAPHPHRGRNKISATVATRDCKRDTVLGGAVATGVPHPLTGHGYSLGTASRDAVPQRPDWQSLRPERPAVQPTA